ncbi:MAG: hypothetical protein M0T86_02955 [Betaproteobacteria bacterium]|nr:hypothetical protein [Betaproteobacteria bacterium]
MNSLPGEIGGYFGLDLADHGDPYPEALHYQSARAALRAVFACNDTRRIWIPSYICDSVIQAAHEAGCEISLYALNDNLRPVDAPEKLQSGELFLYVNYFGLMQDAIEELRQYFPATQLVIDNSHAFYAKHTDVLATVYSPRKFAGLPDGGLLFHSAALKISPPAEEDHGSFARMKFLLMRAAYSAREGYAAFNEARQSLNGQPPLSMSRLTRRLMRSIDWQHVRCQRRSNFATMHNIIGPLNHFDWNLANEDVPLCYPLMIPEMDMAAVKSALAANGIFVATYWPDVLPRLRPGSMEAALVHETLFLPVDQRLDSAQTAILTRQILETLHRLTPKWTSCDE